MPALPSAATTAHEKAVCISLAVVTSGVDKLANVDASTTVANLEALKAPVDTAVAAISRRRTRCSTEPNITEITHPHLRQFDHNRPAGCLTNAAVGETAAAVQAGAVAVRDTHLPARTTLACM